MGLSKLSDLDPAEAIVRYETVTRWLGRSMRPSFLMSMCSKSPGASCVGPFAQGALDEALDLAVGLRPVGAGELGTDTQIKGFTYQRSIERTQALDGWIHHYNWHRPHQGIGGIAPMAKLTKSPNNLLTLHN